MTPWAVPFRVGRSVIPLARRAGVLAPRGSLFRVPQRSLFHLPPAATVPIRPARPEGGREGCEGQREAGRQGGEDERMLIGNRLGPADIKDIDRVIDVG